jgi:hypothetical protein
VRIAVRESPFSYSMSTRRGLPVCDIRGAERWEDFEPLVARLIGLGVEVVQRIEGPDMRLLHFIYRGEPLTLACDDPYGHELWAVEEGGRGALEALVKELTRPSALSAGDSAPARHTVPPVETPEPMKTGWDPDLKQRILEAIPCHWTVIFGERFVLASDPDKVVRGGYLFRKTELLAIDGDRHLYATHQTVSAASALVWLTMDGDRVVEATFIEGDETTRILIAHRFDFPAVQTAQLQQLFAPGVRIEDGYHHHMHVKARQVEPRPGGGELRRYTISTPPAVVPRRLARLTVTVDASGAVVDMHQATHREVLVEAERFIAQLRQQSSGL